MSYIREFVDLAVELNFTRTAKNHHFSPSVLSKHIASLENELGVKLFDRDNTSVELTRAGRAFYEGIRPIVEDYYGFMERFEATYHNQRDVLPVVVCNHEQKTLSALGEAKLKLQDEYHVEMSFSMSDGDLSREHVSQGDILIAYSSAIPRGDDIVTFPLFRDPLVAIVEAGHPLADKERMSLTEDVARRKIVRLGGEYFAPGRIELESVLAHHGIDEPVFNYSLATTIEELAFIGDFKGVLLFPRSSADLFAANPANRFVVIPVEEPDACFVLSLACSRRRAETPVVKTLVELLTERLGGVPA